MMYEFKAVHRETGGISSDTVQIDAVPSFLMEMDQQGYTVIALKRIGGVPSALGSLLKRSKPRLVDKGMAFLELAAFLKAGIPLKNALRQLASEANPVLSRAFDLAVRSLDKGTDFHEALAVQPELTAPWEIEAIRAAEVSGSLAECLDYLGNQALKTADFQSKVRSAMIYPVLVLCVTIGVVVVLVVFVMPILTSMIPPDKLPMATRILLNITGFVRKNWLILLAAAAGLWAFLRKLVTGEAMVVRRETLLMRLPGWGRILKGSYVVRFAKTFSTLLESGVRVLPALQYAGQATGSRLFADSATEIRREVEHGARVGESMRRTGVFPPLLCELASAGENSGSLPEMMAKAAAFYESDVSRMLDSISSLIEPVLIVIVGAIVCVLGLAVFGPIMEAVNNPM